MIKFNSYPQIDSIDLHPFGEFLLNMDMNIVVGSIIHFHDLI